MLRRTLLEPTLPGGARFALIVNIMYEGWDEDSWPGLSPLGNPIPPGIPDLAARSWADYGVRQGIWRLLEVLGSYEVQATAFVSGVLASRAPESVAALSGHGHEVAGHGFSQGVLTPSLSVGEEEAMVERSLLALRAAGASPTGWISPRCTPSAATARILASHGVVWWGDVFDDDLPYRFETESGSLVAFPFGLQLNDLPMVVRYGRPIEQLVDVWLASYEASLAARTVGYVDLTLHAHVGGRPDGARVLDRILADARARSSVWIGSRGELLAMCHPRKEESDC
jgi:peptidoglycan/xylan/chitin deacetylase (PgdA/CDA1 family)